MNKLHSTVNAVLEEQRLRLLPSTFESRKGYLIRLARHGDDIGIDEPCQELYDSYINSRTLTHDLRFQMYHAVRLVDKKAGTKALTPEGELYNEPELPSEDKPEDKLRISSFPVPDGTIDTGSLIIRAKHEMEYLNLSDSTNGQYMKAWRELYSYLYLNGDTSFKRDLIHGFINSSIEAERSGTLNTWKRKIQCRASYILLEVAETGRFEWKFFRLKQIHCPDDSLEQLRTRYRESLQTRNLEKNTVDLHDYTFRCIIENTGVRSVSDLNRLTPSRVQQMITAFSGRLCLNSQSTIFPIIRQIFSYLYTTGVIPTDFSGMILTPAYQRTHLRPYLTSGDEEKLYSAMEGSSLRTKAMMRMALRLGLRDIDICNLRFDQIDWVNDRITLTQEKTGVSLVLPLLEDVGNSLMDYIMNERPEAAKNCPYVFVREQAPYLKLTTMYNSCSRLFIRAGVKPLNRCSHGTHVCRYTLTHKLLKAKVPHQVITDTLGHVSKESDKPYISMEEEMLRECPLDLSLIGQKYWEEGDTHA